MSQEYGRDLVCSRKKTRVKWGTDIQAAPSDLLPPQLRSPVVKSSSDILLTGSELVVLVSGNGCTSW